MSTKLLRSRYSYLDYYGNFEPMIITVSGWWIEQMYFPHWKHEMRKKGKHELISLENCIEDWVVVNWAERI